MTGNDPIRATQTAEKVVAGDRQVLGESQARIGGTWLAPPGALVAEGG